MNESETRLIRTLRTRARIERILAISMFVASAIAYGVWLCYGSPTIVITGIAALLAPAIAGGLWTLSSSISTFSELRQAQEAA